MPCLRQSIVIRLILISSATLSWNIVFPDNTQPSETTVTIPLTTALFGIRTTWNGDPVYSEKVLGKRAVMRFLLDSLDWPSGFKKPKLELLDDPEDPGLVWAHLPLEPGTYCLLENPASLARKEKSYAFHPRGMRFQLSFGYPVHYLGTLSYHFIGKRLTQPIDMAFSLEQDGASATRVAREAFGVESGITESPFEPLDEVRALTKNSNARLVVADRGTNLLIAANLPRTIGQQDLYYLGSFAITVAPNLLLSTSRSVASSGFWADSDFMGWESGAYQVMGALVVLGVTGNYLRAQKHKNLAAMIEEELQGENPMSDLVNRVSSRLGARGIANSDDARQFLEYESKPDIQETIQIQLQKISVRECAKGNMCFEFSIRVRIWNNDTERYTYEELFVYSNPTAIAMEPEDLEDYYNSGKPMYPLFYETRLPGASKRMKKLNFNRNSKKTRALLHTELGNALAEAEDAITRRLQGSR